MPHSKLSLISLVLTSFLKTLIWFSWEIFPTEKEPLSNQVTKPLLFYFSLADYLQYSKAFFLISVLTILIGVGLILSSCLPRRGSMTTNLDLKVSMISFISGTTIDWQDDARVKLSREQNFSMGFSSSFSCPFSLSILHQVTSYLPCLII